MTGQADGNRATVSALLLGRLHVLVDGRVVDTWSSRRTRDLLAYLLTHRQVPVQRDVLMDVFWPDAAPDAARNSLHVALSGVRRALRAAGPTPLLECRHHTYRWADGVDVWVDVETFQRHCRDGRRAEQAGDTATALRAYERAGQLYDGDFLAEDPYADWAAGLRESLRMEAIEALSRLVGLYAAQGDHGAASLVARRVLAADPCNEPVHRRLMESYARCGQMHLALLQFHRCRQALWDELRVAPSRDTVVLYESLRGGGRLPRTDPGHAAHRGLPRAVLHIESRWARV